MAIWGLLKYIQEDETCLPFREERIERRIGMQYTEATGLVRHGLYLI
jgi:hypothetical protein